jgi:hypothetical protein
MMVAGRFRQIRFGVILLAAFLCCGCATYPAFEDPDIDYNGRWDLMDGGYGAYYDPSFSMFDETPDFWDGDPGYGGYYYHYQSGDDPHRYQSH